MIFTAKGFDFPISEKNGGYWIDFRKFLELTASTIGNINLGDVNKILNKIPKEYYLKYQPISKGRNSKADVFISANGIVSYLSSTYRFSHSEKLDILNQFKKLGLVSNDLVLSVSRSELSFLSDLQDFFSFFNKKVDCQVIIADYIVDFVIDSIAIEFDENDHKNYNKENEKKRDSTIKELGYKLIRVSDKNSNAYNLAIIAKAVL